MSTSTIDRSNAPDIIITVTLQPEDYRKPAIAELKELTKNANLKGFRPGKVPLTYMQKRYGKHVMARAITEGVDKELKELVDRENLAFLGELQPVSGPSADSFNIDYNGEIIWVFEGALFPEVEEVDLSALKDVNRYTLLWSDEGVHQHLVELSRSLGEYITVDSVETEEDEVTLVVADPELDAKFYGKQGAAHSAEPTIGNDAKDDADADTAQHDDVELVEVVEESPEEDPRDYLVINPSELIEEQRYKLIGKSIGTEVILSLKDFEDESTLLEAEGFIPQEGTVSFTIAQIEREQLPELNDETIDIIFDDDPNITTLEEAKSRLRKHFTKNTQANADEYVTDVLRDTLIASNSVDVSEKGVRARVWEIREEINEEQKKEEGEQQELDPPNEAEVYILRRQITWHALRQKLLEQFNLKVQPEDIEREVELKYIKTLVERGLDPERLREMIYDNFKANLMQDRDFMINTHDKLLTQKVLERLDEEGFLGSRKEILVEEFKEQAEAYYTRLEEIIGELKKQPLTQKPLSTLTES